MTVCIAFTVALGIALLIWAILHYGAGPKAASIKGKKKISIANGGSSTNAAAEDIPDAAGNFLQEMHLVCSKDDSTSWPMYFWHYIQNLLHGMTLGLIPAPEGMGDERMQNHTFTWNLARIGIAGTCAYLVLFPGLWGCFGAGKFTGMGAWNPCPGMDGGLLWKIIISMFAFTYNIFGLVAPQPDKMLGIIPTNNSGSLYKGTIVDQSRWTRNKWSNKVGLNMGGGGWTKDFIGPVVQNTGRFAIALLLLYFGKKFLLWLNDNSNGAMERCCPCFFTSVS